MEERILVRVDEEKPSDERIAVRLVEARTMDDDYKYRLDAILGKLDNITSVNTNINADILREVKNILSGLHTSIASVERKYVDLSDNIQTMKSRLGVDYGERELGEKKIKESVDSMKSSLDRTTQVLDRNYYDIYDDLQKIRESLDSDNKEDIKAMISDLMAAMSALGRKYDSVYESTNNERMFTELENLEDKTNRMITDLEDIKNEGTFRIISDLENLHSAVTGQALADAEKFDVIRKLIESKAPDKVVEDVIENGLSEIKSSLVSELDSNYASMSEQIGDYKEVAKKMDQIKKSVTSTGTKMVKNEAKIDKTIQNFNSYLQRLNSVDYMLRLLQAKEMMKTRKKLPKWAVDKKKMLNKLVNGLEEEVTDIMIVNILPKEGMALPAISKAVNRSQKITKNRLNQMITNQFAEQRRVGRRTLYFLKK